MLCCHSWNLKAIISHATEFSCQVFFLNQQQYPLPCRPILPFSTDGKVFLLQPGDHVFNL